MTLHAIIFIVDFWYLWSSFPYHWWHCMQSLSLSLSLSLFLFVFFLFVCLVFFLFVCLFFVCLWFFVVVFLFFCFVFFCCCHRCCCCSRSLSLSVVFFFAFFFFLLLSSLLLLLLLLLLFSSSSSSFCCSFSSFPLPASPPIPPHFPPDLVSLSSFLPCWCCRCRWQWRSLGFLFTSSGVRLPSATEVWLTNNTSITSAIEAESSSLTHCKQSGEPLEQPPGQCGNSTFGWLLQEKTGQALGSTSFNVRPRMPSLNCDINDLFGTISRPPRPISVFVTVMIWLAPSPDHRGQFQLFHNNDLIGTIPRPPRSIPVVSQ